MTVTAAQFRTDFPEFADTARYSDGMVSFWLTYALAMLNADRWGSMLDHGVKLMLAHQCVLAAKNGKAPGGIVAPQTAKAVDKVSVAYDTASVQLENAGHWNGSTYGIQFLQLARMMGAGGMQL